MDQIYSILIAKESSEENQHYVDVALSNLNLRLSESLVLEVLRHGGSSNNNVLYCLKFFDWAGRQPGFKHTRNTFFAIFKILSRAKLMSVTLQFLQDFKERKFFKCVSFHETLVMGYALAGKTDIALQLFGSMRFRGLDLDPFSYSVVLNAFVEQGFYEVADMIAKQIAMRGLESDITHSIMVKSYCKQNKLKEAESYVLELVESGECTGGSVPSVLVDGLCRRKRFEQALKLMEEFREGGVPMERCYGIWLKYLADVGDIDVALEFLRSVKVSEGYVPEVFRYNSLIFRLLKEDRLEDVCDLVVDMEENQIKPDKVTLNAVLCFFCKAGMVDYSIELYNARSEFGLTLNSMAFNYLVNYLCKGGSVEEAYRVLENCIERGHFPSKKTFFVLADALYRAGEIDKMKELFFVALDRDYVPCDNICNKFVAALCKSKRLEDAYLIHSELNKILRKGIGKKYYPALIRGLVEANRGDVAARLLLEMQEKNIMPGRGLFRAVICCLCDMENPESQFFKLLEMQLSQHKAPIDIYTCFIDGAGHAKKPELAKKVHDLISLSGMKPTFRSDLVMLMAYVGSGRIADALSFFNELSGRRIIGRKLYDAIILGLTNSDKLDFALHFVQKMKINSKIPSNQCYEVLIQMLCRRGRYDLAIQLVNDMEKTRHRITSFVGNVLLLHADRSTKLYLTWTQMRNVLDETTNLSLLRQLIGVFSGCIGVVNPNVEELEDMIELCFPPDHYTRNLLLRKLCRSNVDDAGRYYEQICEKGFVPNPWTYSIIIDALNRHGRRDAARRWEGEMLRHISSQTNSKSTKLLSG